MTVTSGAQYVDPDYSGGSSDGSSTDPWTSISAAEANYSGTCDGNCTIYCQSSSGTTDSTNATINFAVGAYTFEVRAARNGEWGGGNPTGGFYGGADIFPSGYFTMTTTVSDCLTLSTANIIVDGIPFYHNADSNGKACISVDELGCTVVDILRCRLYGDPGKNICYGISCTNQRLTNAVTTIDSCMFAGFAYTLGSSYNGRGITCGFRSSQTTGTINLYNNSFAYIATYGIAFTDSANNAGNTINIKGNAAKTVLASGQDIDFASIGANTVLNVDYNATDDDIHTYDSHWTDLSGTSITGIFNAPGASPSASSDLHALRGGSPGPLVGNGSAFGETTDVDDDDCTGTTDIGADRAGASGDTNPTATGIAASAAVGGLTPGVLKALSGNASSAAIGDISVTFGQNATVGLSGNAGGANVGALAWTGLKALAGVAGSGNAGSFTPQVTPSLAGVAGSGNAGSFTPEVTPSLAGNAAAAAIGDVSITLITNASTTLSGVAASAAIGTVSEEALKALSGVAASGAVGTFSLTVEKALSGIAGNAALGTITVGGTAVTVALSGVAALAGVGSFTVTATNPLTLYENTLYEVYIRRPTGIWEHTQIVFTGTSFGTIN